MRERAGQPAVQPSLFSLHPLRSASLTCATAWMTTAADGTGPARAAPDAEEHGGQVGQMTARH